jgi:hypothetical protein
MTWFTTLCIYLLPIQPPIYLINYLLTYYSPTHLHIIYLLTYLRIPFHLPAYIPTYVFHLRTTYLHIIYLPIHSLTYLILTIMCNHDV